MKLLANHEVDYLSGRIAGVFDDAFVRTFGGVRVSLTCEDTEFLVKPTRKKKTSMMSYSRGKRVKLIWIF